jgi:hypothetical protein
MAKNISTPIPKIEATRNASHGKKRTENTEKKLFSVLHVFLSVAERGQNRTATSPLKSTQSSREQPHNQSSIESRFIAEFNNPHQGS